MTVFVSSLPYPSQPPHPLKSTMTTQSRKLTPQSVNCWKTQRAEEVMINNFLFICLTNAQPEETDMPLQGLSRLLEPELSCACLCV